MSKTKYNKTIYALDKKEYPLKQLIPIGLYILDLLNYKYLTGHDRKLLMKFSELKGAKNSWYYLKIHWANRIILLIIGLIFILLVGLITNIDIAYCFYSICFLAVIIASGEWELERQLKKRHFSIKWDFPEFLNKVAVLVNAGLTVYKAWEKTVKENRSPSYFYKEAEIVIKEIEAGKSELRAYEDFARRCRTAEVARFVTIIIQNIRKGNEELSSILRVLSAESWEMRKNTAKRLGEEASAKMVLPMTIMFIAIVLIVSTPAILSIIKM
ncbi:MAG TPA: type II secretion system F family protein [Clostridiaceae bacterium]|nr:type II secretion system F family protein [Clostridiaceae bacterium]